MNGVYRAFSIRTLGTGITLLAVGLLCAIQLFLPDLSGKIYLVPLLVSVPFLLAGIWTLGSSFAAYFCEQCRTELKEESVAVSMMSENALQQVLQLHAETAIAQIEVVPNSEKPALRVTMRYCPMCVEVAMVKVRPINIPWTTLQGSIVRTLKERLLF